MSVSHSHRVTSGLCFLALCAVGPIICLWLVAGWGDRLSYVDQYSEANVLRELRHFLEDGLASHYGLGTVYYPGMYPEDGFAAEKDVSMYGVSSEGVYTHYPPGPEYLAYAAARVFGATPVSHLRLLPITIGWVAITCLGLSVRRRFGTAVGWLVMGACAITPTVWDGFVGLHDQGYAGALLMIELALAIGPGTGAWSFALLGFLQGWLTFDYFFLVGLTPLAVELAMPRIDPDYRPRWKLALTRTLLASGGFAAAHGLHFMEVWAYWGSFSAALNDFRSSAAHRSGIALFDQAGLYSMVMLLNFMSYFVGLHPLSLSLIVPDFQLQAEWGTFRFLGLSLGPWWVVVTLVLSIGRLATQNPQLTKIRTKWTMVWCVGAAVSSVWFVVMVNHGYVHRHFLYRHQFILFFLMILFLSVGAERWVRFIRPLARAEARDAAHPGLIQ
ncbi:hypothetical protein ABIB82_007451 [Bradyrhizobium sp. i1.8.4]|uniref:hypothetical protein n=1 Tax=unclassified Bradyrhizobium TaxID=2631580 RepID=UPI003D1F587E